MSTDDVKTAIRTAAKAARTSLKDRSQRSGRVLARVLESTEFKVARAVLFYVDVRTEVKTREAIPKALAAGKIVAVPFCVADSLSLLRIDRLEDLVPGTFGILEPRAELREDPERILAPQSFDLALIPGLAFDRAGNRLGYGRGFYDRLLGEFRSDVKRMGLAFACQIFPEIPADLHDQRVDLIVTEEETITCGA